MMIFQTHFRGDLGPYSYLLVRTDRRDAVVIDPVPERLDDYVELGVHMDFRIAFSLETGAVPEASRAAACLGDDLGTLRIGPASARARSSEAGSIAEAARIPLHGVSGGERLHLAGLDVEVLDVDEGCGRAVAYRIDDRVFSGQAISADEPHLCALPPDTLVYRAHADRGQHFGLLGLELGPTPAARSTWRSRALPALRAS